MTTAARPLEPLYLSSVALDNFRAYGTGVQVSFPSGPGVVVLSGANGLGKTSLLEAIEWGLTGRIRRLEQALGTRYSPRELLRKGAEDAWFGVVLDFSGNHVRRTQQVPSDGELPATAGTPVQEVAQLLSPNELGWSVTGENLPQYLYLTHIHPQASAVRLVMRSREERWDLMRTLAGADVLTRARTTLTNSRGSLGRIVTQARTEQASALQDLDAWQQLLTRRELLLAEVRALQGALPPNEVAAELMPMAREYLPEAQLRALALGDAASIQNALAGIRGALQSRSSLLEERALRLVVAFDIAQGWSHDLQTETRAATAASALQEQVSAVSREISDVQAAHEIRAVQLRDSSASLLALEQELARIGELNAAVVELSEVAPRLRDAQVALSHAEASIAEEQSRAARAQADVVAREKSEADLLSLQTSLQQVDELQSYLVRWRDLGPAQAAAAAEYEAALRAAKAAAAAYQSSHHAVQSALVASNAAKARLEAVREDSARIEVALGVVIASITPDQTRCPVCDSHFQPEELAARARARMANTAGTRLAQAQEEAQLAFRALASAEAATAECAKQRDEANARLADTRSRLDDIERARSELLPTALLTSEGPVEFERQLATKRKGLAQALEALTKELGGHELSEALRQRAADSAAALQKAQSSSSAARVVYSSLSQRAAELSAKVQRLRFQLKLAESGDVGAHREQVARQLDTARVKRDEDQRLVAALRARLGELSEREQALEAEATSAARQLDEARRLVALKRERWSQLGLQAEPLAESVENAKAAISADKALIEQHLAHQQRLSESLRAWERAAELREADTRIDQARGQLAPEDHTKLLSTQVQRKRDLLRSAERADRVARSLADVLAERGKEYATHVVRPLGPMLERYLRALVHDTRFHDIHLKAVSQSRKGWVDLLLGADWSDDGEDVAAEAIMSEGQLSGVSLAMLLSMSTAYQWSSWRALLLDDPTQYNDLIHATALFEVLRNLVLHEGYQVVLATHDPEQADFFLRKLRAARVECVEYRYVGQSCPRLRA